MKRVAPLILLIGLLSFVAIIPGYSNTHESVVLDSFAIEAFDSVPPDYYYELEIPSIAGVEMGTSYKEAKAAFDQRFNNGESSYQFTANELNYYDVRIGGIYYDYATFYFQNQNGRTYMNSAILYNSYELNETKKAKQIRDYISDLYDAKYPLRWSIVNDDGFKDYVHGYDPFNPEDGYIVISLTKAKTKSGEYKLWVMVLYTPINFVSPLDEI